jgi:hypothetical protein
MMIDVACFPAFPVAMGRFLKVATSLVAWHWKYGGMGQN